MDMKYLQSAVQTVGGDKMFWLNTFSHLWLDA